LTAAGTTTLFTFEEFATGTILSTQLSSRGIATVSGVDRNGIARNVVVGSETSLPSSFIGVTSLTAFTQARFFSDNTFDSWGFDDLEMSSTGSVVPEPGTTALLATGLIAIAGIARRRRFNAA